MTTALGEGERERCVEEDQPGTQAGQKAEDAARTEQGDEDLGRARAGLFDHDGLQTASGNGADQVDASSGPCRPGCSVPAGSRIRLKVPKRPTSSARESPNNGHSRPLAPTRERSCVGG